MERNDLQDAFVAQFNENPTNYFFAPGRINLIGEHTDYNGGHVFPCAISLGTYAAVSARDDQEFHFFSQNFDTVGTIVATLDQLKFKKDDVWANYAKGMLDVLQHQGFSFPHGLNVLVWGDLPNGAGLSSSASLELLVGQLLKTMYQLDVSMLDLIKDGQQVENHYIGVNSGIMDQFAIGMGKADHAVLLDTNTLDYDSLPLNLGDHVIVIMNTNKRRSS